MNKSDLLGFIKRSPINRWEGLRMRPNGSLVELPNDGRLETQLAGLTQHLERLAPHFNGAAKSYNPKDIALGYVARQIGPEGIAGCNHLLNNQTDKTRATDAEILRDHADGLQDTDWSLSNSFREVASALEGNNADIRNWIDAANCMFYLETGVKAALRADEMVEEDPDRAIYLDLAANALGNNYKKAQQINRDMAAEAMLPLAGKDDLLALVLDQDRYKRSVEKAKAAAPSCNRQPS